MSLKFESVSLKNFGPYRSVQNLRLDTSSESPVVMIHGENTLGKTSLFRALRWCLYGSPEASKSAGASNSTLVEYMNRPARREGDREMKVSMTFTAKGQRYQLTRVARFDERGMPDSTADLRINAEVMSPSSIEAEIGRLLHPQISEFFLFDGELLRDFYDRLNTVRERDLLRSSIENVLGIPALQLAENDVSVLTDDALDRQAKAAKDRSASDAAQRRLRELASKHESLQKDTAEYQTALRKAQVDLENIKVRIAAVDELKADAREMEGLEAAIAGGRAEESRLEEEMARILATGWLSLVAPRLNSALRDVRAKNDLAHKAGAEVARAEERVRLLQEQVRGGTCPTCNQSLPHASHETVEELERAQEQLNRLREDSAAPDLAQERRIRELIDDSTAAIYRDKFAQLNRVRADQFERQRRLAIIKDRMKDNDAAAIRKLGDEQEQLERAIETYDQKLRDIRPQQEALKAEQDKAARILARLGSRQPEVAVEATFFSYIRTLLTRTIEGYRESTRQEVEARASDMFARLIRDPEGYQGLRIGPDYRVDLLGRQREAMRTSEGGKQLVALSLIGALKVCAVRGGPVVLDSPLARLDLEHRASVLQTWIPELGSQAILLVQSGELTTSSAREIMGSKIGLEYRIHRPNSDPEEAVIERTA